MTRINNTPLLLHFDPNVKQMIKAMAAKHGRSMTKEINQLIICAFVADEEIQEIKNVKEVPSAKL
jgi:plasmid stability protein